MLIVFQPGKRAVVDAGLKALSVDSGMPVIHNRSDLSYESGGDEHGILSSDENFKVNQSMVKSGLIL